MTAYYLHQQQHAMKFRKSNTHDTGVKMLHSKKKVQNRACNMTINTLSTGTAHLLADDVDEAVQYQCGHRRGLLLLACALAVG